MSIRAKVRAQTLDTRIRVERNTPTSTSTGGQIDNWSLVVECWARVDGAKASAEPVVDGGIRTQRDYSIWVRSEMISRYNITPLDRIIHNGRIMNIGDIPDQGLRGNLIAMICKAGLNQG
jgi:SPP1 family predicted phage head-tail adaptor